MSRAERDMWPKKLAEIHRISFEEIAKQTSQNASELFGFSNLSD